LKTRLREVGFPDTLPRFQQFIQIIESYIGEKSSKKIFVLDDFHQVESPEILLFIERCILAEIPGLYILIVSRENPQLNIGDLISLIAVGKVSVIKEEVLRFTKDEIDEFLNFKGITVNPDHSLLFLEATKGWPLAVQILSIILAKKPASTQLALNIMKENIFKIFEAEAFVDFPEDTKKEVIRLALVSDTPQIPFKLIVKDTGFLNRAQKLSSFIWHELFVEDYGIHPLYLEFLQGKQDILSSEEKKDTYKQAAKWCYENGFYLDAMGYFAKSNQYKQMVDLIFSYPFKLPYDTCEYFFNVIENIEINTENEIDINVLTLKNFFAPLLLMGMGKYQEAKTRSLDIIRRWENKETPFAFGILCSCYSNLAYIDMYNCTVSHEYQSPKYLKKSVEYFKKLPAPPKQTKGPFAVPDIRSFACLVGVGAPFEAFEEFLRAAKETAFYIEETFHDMYYGYEDIVACEIDFYKNQLEQAKKYAHQGILKARQKGQYSIEAMAEGYLLKIAVAEGDYLLAKEIIKQLDVHLDNKDFWNRQGFYDLLTGTFYAQIGLPGKVATWLLMNEKEEATHVRIPTEELIVSVRTYIALKRYDLALTVLYNSYPRVPNERFLFGELIILLLTAVAKMNTGNTPGAIEDFKKAYELSFNGVFEMPFIELGKELHPLVSKLLKENSIPTEWLKRIDRKASAYGKKATIVLEAFKRDHDIVETIKLSKREQEVLIDLYQGLSREEIAESRYLSVNTVKKILQSIYIKLDANSSVDAVRIAIEEKLIR
jgi:LuxR family maltose regulon positive regulatory protein